MENNDGMKQLSVEVNTLYMMSLAMDLLIRDAERRLRMDGAVFHREKKSLFNRFMQAVKTACILQEDLTQDIYREDERHNYRNVQIWQEEANELARLMLMYADRSASQESCDKIHEFIKTIPGDGIVDEDMLKQFYLIQSYE